MSDRLEGIRSRLEKATPGPWEPVPTVGNAVVSPDTDGYWTDVADRIESEADAELIAHAPADLAYLLAELDRARAGLAEAWDEGYWSGWRGRTRSILEGQTYEQECATKEPNPYKEAP